MKAEENLSAAKFCKQFIKIHLGLLKMWCFHGNRLMKKKVTTQVKKKIIVKCGEILCKMKNVDGVKFFPKLKIIMKTNWD